MEMNPNKNNTAPSLGFNGFHPKFLMYKMCAMKNGGIPNFNDFKLMKISPRTDSESPMIRFR